MADAPSPALAGRRAALLAAAAGGLAAAARPDAARAQNAASPAQGTEAALERVAQFEQQVTGVAVSRNGRIFVNFPRWEQDVEISVAEVGRDGSLRPFPNAQWNSYRNRAPRPLTETFVCVQSVTVDPQGFLWILDPAAPGNEFNKPGGVKLLKVDLNGDRVVQTILFDTRVAPQGSYLNDVRVSPDGRWAFITDSGQRGALVVVDLGSGAARRVLDGHPSTQAEPDVIVHADGRELRRTDGRPTLFSADGIALDAEGRNLYWQALTGKTLYRLPVAALIDPDLPAARLEAAVEKLGTTGVADGLWMDGRNNLYVTSPEDNALKLRTPDGQMRTLMQDPRLRWPDSLAEGSDGSIFVTTSQIQDVAQYHEKGSARTQPYGLWKVTPAR
ncbi:SMP-30/gluconolactonase/LRE family protein [Roseomonas sp. BN140053]|uniref:SMP-30/gluconolactonase/LRE family protein n=1 Tax=Roseomonas sp. BN140053 TaxID=3391898 RepID=UPI0039E8E790